MRADDVTETLNLALKASGCDRAEVVHKPRLLSDNGSSYISGDLADWLEERGMNHVRGAPYHPQTQGKIERWHQTLKNRILLENYYLPGDRRHPLQSVDNVYTTISLPHIDRWRQSGEGIDDRQDANPGAIEQLVRQKVHGPDLVRPRGWLAVFAQLRRSLPLRPFAADL